MARQACKKADPRPGTRTTELGFFAVEGGLLASTGPNAHVILDIFRGSSASWGDCQRHIANNTPLLPAHFKEKTEDKTLTPTPVNKKTHTHQHISREIEKKNAHQHCLTLV